MCDFRQEKWTFTAKVYGKLHLLSQEERNDFGHRRDHVNGKQTEKKLVPNGDEKFLSQIWSIYMEICRRILSKIPRNEDLSSLFKSSGWTKNSRPGESDVMCASISSHLLLLITVIFCLINFMDLHKRKRLELDKNLYLAFFLYVGCLQRQRRVRLLKKEFSWWRGFLSSRLESFTRAKVRKVVIQMEISSSLVIFTFIITTNVFILISTDAVGSVKMVKMKHGFLFCARLMARVPVRRWRLREWKFDEL